MNKKVLILATSALITIGTVTAVYAKGSSTSNSYGYGRGMMYQNAVNTANDTNPTSSVDTNSSYSRMIDLMKQYGFDAGAKAMENKDYNAMRNFMNSLSDDQYNQMINIMKNNGYGDMASVMSSISRQQMVNIHNSMMSTVNRQQMVNIHNSMMGR